MSEAAQTLLHYAENSRSAVADDSGQAECAARARQWAAFIIGFLA